VEHIPEVNTKEYTYRLPDERIARYPLTQRDQAKLLIYRKGIIHTDCFCHLEKYLHPDDVLVTNNTKVIRARLFFHKPTGAMIEIFCLEPVFPADYEQIFAAKDPVVWECLVGNAKKWKTGILQARITTGDSVIILTAERVKHPGNDTRIRFSWDNPSISFGKLLDTAGVIPIPPYLKRKAEDSDIEQYQTVYALREGSVAAPTAGLHFTPGMLEKIKTKITLLELTLHVGAGTFKPIHSEHIEEHIMHTEHFSVTHDFINALPANGKRIIAVGTTSVRTIESLYWLAVKIKQKKTGTNDSLFIDQWDPYRLKPTLSTDEAKVVLSAYMKQNNLQRLNGSTRLMIIPGYHFRYITGLVTNFHLPKSSLLLLIAAFTGNDWKKIYQYALEHDYRFLSYGDASLLIP